MKATAPAKRVLEQVKETSIGWPLKDDLTDSDPENLLFPDSPPVQVARQRPNLKYTHKEMAKSVVMLILLWTEYCTNCRIDNEQPLMYSQFCYYYQQYALKKRATMHIQRKPGEQIEVDWAGQLEFEDFFEKSFTFCTVWWALVDSSQTFFR